MGILPTLLLSATAIWCQVAEEVNKDYATPQDRANIVKRLEAPARLAKVRPEGLVARLDIRAARRS